MSSAASGAIRRRAGSVVWLGLAEAAPRATAFLLQFLIARALTRADFALFSYASALFYLLVPAMSLGLLEAFVREGAVARDRMGEVLSEFFSVRCVTASATLAAAWALARAHRPDFWVVLAIGAYQVVRSMTQFLATLFRARERMHGEFLVRAAEAAAILAVGAAAIAAGLSLGSLVAALLVAALAALGGFLVLYRRWLPGFSWRIPTSVVAAIARAMPLGLPQLLALVLMRADIVVLERSGAPPGEVAALACAVNLLLGVCLLATVTSAALYPALSRALAAARPGRRVARTAAGFLLAGSAAAVLLAVSARPLVLLAYGPRYLDAAPLVRAFAPAVALLFPAFFAATALASAGRRAALLALSLPAWLGNLAAVALRGGAKTPLAMAPAAIAASGLMFAISLICLVFLGKPRAPAPS